jgi:hypothetical protein
MVLLTKFLDLCGFKDNVATPGTSQEKRKMDSNKLFREKPQKLVRDIAGN